MSVASIVSEAIQVLQQSQSKTVPPPDTLPRDFLATAQILAQDPGLRRPLGVAGEAVFTAWTTQDKAKDATATIVRGNGQVASVGTAVRIPPAVLVTDGFGRPLADVDVEFAVRKGVGTIVGATATTGLDGVASLKSWAMGPEPGENTVKARDPSVAPAFPEVTFFAFGVATRRCELHDGNNQTKPKGTEFEVAVRVVQADSGLPVAGVDVSFRPILGNGEINDKPGGDTETTDTDGIARVEWKLGDAGTNTVEADAFAADPVTFIATAF